MPIRSNGRILGVSNNPSKTSGPGIWDVDDQYTAGYGGNWDDDGDPFINNVILNLPASGTNGGANLTFLDSSPSAVTVTRNGDVYQGSFSPYAVNGWSAHFNGSSYLTLPSATFNEAQPSNATFTMEAYVMLLAYGTSTTFGGAYNRCIFGKGQTNMNFGIDSDGALMLYTWDGSAKTGKAGNVPLGRWTHVAVTVSSSVITFFINGNRVGTATYFGFQSSGLNAGANVGSTADGNAGSNVQWIGFISNARFTTSVLYTRNFTPSLIPLQAPTSSTKLLACHSYTWVDGSSTANAIAISGSPRVTPTSPFRGNNKRYSPSTNGGSGYFDGTGDYLASTVSAIGTNNFTVDCWFYITSNSSGAVLIDTNSVDNAGDGIVISYASGKIQFFYNNSSGLLRGDTLPNSWYHLAFVRNGTSVTAYVNGKSVGSFTEAARNLSSTKYSIGTFSTRNGLYFPGYISDVRFTVGQALYSTNFTPPDAPITTTSQNATASNVKYLLNFQNASIIDSSQKCQIYTRNALALSNSVAKYSPTSIYFNGTSTNIITIDNQGIYTLGSADFTVECWVYMNSISGTQMIFATNYVSGSTRNFQLYTSSGSLSWADNVVAGGVIIGSSSVVVNTWNHIAATKFNGTANLWLNGINIGTATYVQTLTAPDVATYIGNNPPATLTLNAYISNFRVTLGIARYTANFIPPQRANPLY